MGEEATTASMAAMLAVSSSGPAARSPPQRGAPPAPLHSKERAASPAKPSPHTSLGCATPGLEAPELPPGPHAPRYPRERTPLKNKVCPNTETPPNTPAKTDRPVVHARSRAHAGTRNTSASARAN
ncbi:unnamed protein product [Lasius platythorax]|uniref:Uncharacterized protein n=1 Tax=Lasius platythorax TaxID=488582 RepID=A0AAV2MXY2_9HYME